MKLLNKSIKYLSVSILAIVTLWAIVFYVSMLNEIKSSIDEGLENYKRLIIKNAEVDSTILIKDYFDESFFTIEQIGKEEALAKTDVYLDTMLMMQDADDEELESEPVRMLTTAFVLNDNYYELKVANSMVEEEDLIRELFWNVIMLYVVLILAIIFVNNVVLKRLWKPFYKFLNQLKNFRLGSDENLPESQTNVKEFNDLQSAVNTLLVHNIRAFEQQKQFIGNASHELQTPLAITTNKLELLLEQNDLSENDAENIGEVYTIIQRLVRLNKSLLLLTKIENKQFFDNKLVSMNEIVRQSVHELDDIHVFKGITTSIDETTELVTEMDASLASIMISNLIKNATFHNVENGKIQIQILENSLKIVNTGAPEMLDKELIFNRFYKSESKQNNTGLGLAIVKAIADIYGISIQYHYETSLHYFEITFVSK